MKKIKWTRFGFNHWSWTTRDGLVIMSVVNRVTGMNLSLSKLCYDAISEHFINEMEAEIRASDQYVEAGRPEL